jgi:hypothetical protein
MKTKTKNMFLIAAALTFLITGVSFANDWSRGPYGHQPRWQAKQHFHKGPGYRLDGYRNHFGGHRYHRYDSRPYYKRHYYPESFHRYHRHYRGYPLYDYHYFGSLVR